MGAGVEVCNSTLESAGEILADQIIRLMQQLHVPNGLSAIGFDDSDIPGLVEGTLPQHRVTKLSPRPANADDLKGMFKSSLTLW